MPEMKEDPSEPAYRRRLQNSRKLLSSNGDGGERYGKGLRKSSHVQSCAG